MILNELIWILKLNFWSFEWSKFMCANKRNKFENKKKLVSKWNQNDNERWQDWKMKGKLAIACHGTKDIIAFNCRCCMFCINLYQIETTNSVKKCVKLFSTVYVCFSRLLAELQEKYCNPNWSCQWSLDILHCTLLLCRWSLQLFSGFFLFCLNNQIIEHWIMKIHLNCAVLNSSSLYLIYGRGFILLLLLFLLKFIGRNFVSNMCRRNDFFECVISIALYLTNMPLHITQWCDELSFQFRDAFFCFCWHQRIR